MNAIYILSKKFIAEKEISENIKNIAKKLKLQYLDKIDTFPKYYVSIPDYGDLLEIYPADLDDVESDKEKELFKKEYGALITIYYNNGGLEEDKLLILFLEEFLKIYPEMLVYEDEINNPANIYSKIDFENIQSSIDTTTFFKTPPKSTDTLV